MSLFSPPAKTTKVTLSFDSPIRQPKLHKESKNPFSSVSSDKFHSKIQQSPRSPFVKRNTNTLHHQTPKINKSKSKSKVQTKTKTKSGFVKKPSLNLFNSPKLDMVASDWTLTTTAALLTSPSKSPSKQKLIRLNNTADRFIPNRQSSYFSTKSKLEEAAAADTVPESPKKSSSSSPIKTTSEYNLTQEQFEYQSSVAKACGIALNQRILQYQPPAPQSSRSVDLRSQYNRPLKSAVSAQHRRKIPTAPERVLDAPGLVDDYYLNLLDWSCDNNLAVALETAVYIWDATSGTVEQLMECPANNLVTSISWSEDGAYLSIGLNDGNVEIWDVEEEVKLRTMSGLSARVGISNWNKHILTSGCRDGSIWNHDVRVAQHKVFEFVNHTAEVCGLEWRSDGCQLASGGNDNLVNIWDARSSIPKFTKTNHKAAVKAIAWCPWQSNLLATGGGSNDKCVHFWNGTTGARVNSIDTGSQVTSLRWSGINTGLKEIVSTHGYPDNNISIWSYPTLTKTADIMAHDARILNSAISPDGITLATCASDENLKFWKVFENVGKRVVNDAESTLASGKGIRKVMTIR